MQHRTWKRIGLAGLIAGFGVGLGLGMGGCEKQPAPVPVSAPVGAPAAGTGAGSKAPAIAPSAGDGKAAAPAAGAKKSYVIGVIAKMIWSQRAQLDGPEPRPEEDGKRTRAKRAKK